MPALACRGGRRPLRPLDAASQRRQSLRCVHPRVRRGRPARTGRVGRDAFDPKEWFIVGDDEGEIGVVLPQIFAEDRTAGTLFYVAVRPARRDQGLSKDLHRSGLQRLAQRGALTYRGSTDPEKPAMRAIFLHNGCQCR